MLKIEVLFPEICNLFGNPFNVKYLKNSVKDVEVINTQLTDTPKFLSEKVDMIYMSPMTESSQELVIEKLKPYKENIKKLVQEGQLFLIIGNALEVFGKYIENEDGTKIDGLRITNLYAKRDMMHRFNSLFLGKIEDIKIVGFKSQFAMSYGDNSNNYVFDVIKGNGINKESKYEGIRINNFIGTYVLGPLLILNPYFTKYILKIMGVENVKLQYEKEAIECYEKRLKEFKNADTKYD